MTGGNSLGLLTRKQVLVLALRRAGLGASEIARLLGVTRQDVSSSIKRAERNARRALETLEAFYAASSPVLVRAAPGETLEALAEQLLREADRAGVQLPLGRAELLTYLRGLLAPRLREGRLREPACIATGPNNLPLTVPCSLVEAIEEIVKETMGGSGA